MDVLKQKQTFVSIDKFHRKAIREVGFLVGLHTKLVHWQDLQDNVQGLMDENTSQKIPVEVLRKSVWVDVDNERIGVQIFTVRCTMKQMDAVTAALHDICNIKATLGPQTKFVCLNNSDENFKDELAKVIPT